MSEIGIGFIDKRQECAVIGVFDIDGKVPEFLVAPDGLYEHISELAPNDVALLNLEPAPNSNVTITPIIYVNLKGCDNFAEFTHTSEADNEVYSTLYAMALDRTHSLN